MDAELDQAEAVLDGLAGKIVPGCKALHSNWTNSVLTAVTVRCLCDCPECLDPNSVPTGDPIWLVDCHYSGIPTSFESFESRLTRI